MSKTMKKKRTKSPRCIVFWITEEHRRMIESIAAHHEKPTAADAVRLALANEMNRDRAAVQLMASGPFTTQFCFEASAEDRALVDSVMSLRYARTMSDALRLAIEREAYAVRAERVERRKPK